MSKLRFACLLTAGFALAGGFSAPANAVPVDYTLTFTSTGGAPTGGTGLLVINETLPLNTFVENFAGDIVSFVATIDGLTFHFVPANFTANIGVNQTFFSLTGTSSPGVTGPTNLTEFVSIGGSPSSNPNFHITNNGGPNLEDGIWSISAGVVDTTPLPSTWLMLLAGLIGLGLFARRGFKKGPAAIAAA